MIVALDERSAAFFALGLAKASGRPVALVCTSGTAAANFFPAIAEAALSRVPLIVLTADRPRESRDVGAAQTINQVNLYGSHVKWFQDLPSSYHSGLERHAAQVAARAAHCALSHPQGPVHLNFPLREPLLPEAGGPTPALMGPYFAPVHQPNPAGIAAAQGWLSDARRAVLLLGPETPEAARPLIDVARSRGLPVFVDPLSRTGREKSALTAYDVFLRESSTIPEPDLVIRLGSSMTSKALTLWCRQARLILLDWPLGFREPEHQTSLLLEGNPVSSLKTIMEGMTARDPRYLRQLDKAEDAAETRIRMVLETSPNHFEGHFYHDLTTLWDSEHGPLLTASSMPVRDFDTFYRHGSLLIYGNRGANGIDGLVSTALGISAHHGDVLAVLGDLAFHHDLTGLFFGQKYGLNAFIVVLNNQGGAIFSYLPQSQLESDVFEELFGTPHQVDFSGAATLYGAAFRRVHTYPQFQAAFRELREKTGLRILEWHTTPRDESARVHRQLYQEP